jgi:hypothetical protein
MTTTPIDWQYGINAEADAKRAAYEHYCAEHGLDPWSIASVARYNCWLAAEEGD